jgi:hypothetical protein
MMQLTAGQMVGQYQLVEPAGAGGMSVVWRAADSAPIRAVADRGLGRQRRERSVLADNWWSAS